VLGSSRFAIDLDEVSQLQLLKTFYNLAYFTGKLEAFFTSIENGKENYHVIAYGLPRLPREKELEFRLQFGDDPYRVYLDSRLLNKPKQVLFVTRCKPDPKSGKWVKSDRLRLYTMLWKPWISKPPFRKPMPKRRLKRLMKKLKGWRTK
jgi:hypothetical protein